jgi:hypothetical protein
MHLDRVLSSVPPELASHPRVMQARFLHGLTGVAQLALAAALFVMWHYYHVPFWTAAERCFTIGVGVYIAIGAIAGILLTLARVQPMAVILRYLSNIVAIGIFGVLHYVEGLSFAKSFGIWAAVWITSRVLVGRMERRASGPLIPTR